MHPQLVEDWLLKQKRDSTPEVADFIDDFILMMQLCIFEADPQE